MVSVPKVGKKKRAIKFEEDVKAFLNKLEFDGVDGARDSFQINGIQVDVCGGHEKTLIIIECKHKDELKREGLDNIRSYIKTLRGDIKLLERGFKQHPDYSTYEDFRYVICTKNYKVRKADFEFANQDPHIHIWDENFLEYYQKIYSLIGKYAKYDLLGEMRVKPSQELPILVPAFLVRFGQVKMYNFVIDPKVLLEIAYVARRESRNERNYQRMINKTRLSSIAKYVDEGNILPNNLIISINRVKFHPKYKKYDQVEFPALNLAYGILEFPRDYRSCWIIDGQHRLYAFMKTNKEKYFNMPITAFENLSSEQQCKFFLDINKNQKPVPPDLVWDLNGDMLETEEDGVLSRVAKSLNNSGELFHKIYYPSLGLKTKPVLKISGVCISMKRAGLARPNTISKVANANFNTDHRLLEKNLVKSLNEYLRAIKHVLVENWKLEKKGFVLTDGGMSVMIYLYEKILQRMALKTKIPSYDDFITYLTPLKKLFSMSYTDSEELRKLRSRTSGEDPKREILIEFIMFIREELKDDLFGGDIESAGPRIFREMERNLKELINNILKVKIGDDWFGKLKGVNKEMYGKAVKHAREHGIEDESKTYEQLSIGDCRFILEHKSFEEFFHPVFTKNEYFHNWKEFSGALSQVVRMRNTQKSHDVGVRKKLHDDVILKLNIEKINKCISNYEDVVES